MRTHYDNLKVAENAPDEVIKAAYRALSQKHHPDKNSGDTEAHRIMQIINAAYAVLSDPAQRSRYDESLRVRRQREAADAKKSAPPPVNRSAPPPPAQPPPPPAHPHEDVRAKARANPKHAATAGNVSPRPGFNTERIAGCTAAVSAAVVGLIFLLKPMWTDNTGGGSETDLQSASEMAALGRASKSVPFTNSLGMKFVPVPGTEVLFCIHETRSRDFAAFMADGNRGYTMSGDHAEYWRIGEYKEVPVGRGVGERAEQSNHPVANVSWLDAMAFCDWLSKKEGHTYRLPTDREWSVAVGIPREGTGTPKALGSKIADIYPWDGALVAASITGNYADATAEAKGTGFDYIEGYRDGFATTAPVMSFPANALGLYDMGGNQWEWCAGCYDGTDPDGEHRLFTGVRLVRGGSWINSGSANLLSSCRYGDLPTVRYGSYGFRVVVVGRSGG